MNSSRSGQTLVLTVAQAQAALARAAGAAGPGLPLVSATPRRAAALIGPGSRVIVQTDEAAGPHAAAAVGALACWLGAVAVSTGPAHAAAVRRAVRMAEAIMAGDDGGWPAVS